jgi:hypothetical protein
MTGSETTQSGTAHRAFGRLGKASVVAGAAGVAACILGAAVNAKPALEGYLFAYIFWIGLSLGCLSILLVHQVVAGGWGYTVQRICEAASRTLIAMAMLFLPILLGMGLLYPWLDAGDAAHGAEAVHGEILEAKAAYLNVPFFVMRAALYFAVWLFLAFRMTRWSRKLDQTGDGHTIIRMRRLGAIGLPLYVLTLTFAMVDWGMSLEPEWFSSIYGFTFIVGNTLSALAFCIITSGMLAKPNHLGPVASTGRFHHLANLMLGFVVLWAYAGFSQFIIIWSGNLPEEIPYYLHRMGPGLSLVGVALIVFHFAVPFFILLARRSKRTLPVLMAIAAGLLVMRTVDIYWMIVPAFHPNALHVHWAQPAAFIGIGGIWLTVFVRQLNACSLVPLGDERMAPHEKHDPSGTDITIRDEAPNLAASSSTAHESGGVHNA